jgi:hypothetical protein
VCEKFYILINKLMIFITYSIAKQVNSSDLLNFFIALLLFTIKLFYITYYIRYLINFDYYCFKDKNIATPALIHLLSSLSLGISSIKTKFVE